MSTATHTADAVRRGELSARAAVQEACAARRLPEPHVERFAAAARHVGARAERAEQDGERVAGIGVVVDHERPHIGKLNVPGGACLR